MVTVKVEVDRAELAGAMMEDGRDCADMLAAMGLMFEHGDEKARDFTHEIRFMMAHERRAVLALGKLMVEAASA